MNITDRFLKYVSFSTNSCEESSTYPSTLEQLKLGAYLAEEIKQLGLQGAHMDEYGYVYGVLPASKGCEDIPALGFIAHMDTSPAVCGDNIKPRIMVFTGEDIDLGSGVLLSAKDFPSMKNYIGQELIVTDGTTLLGADDKAGVAEIVTMCEYLISNPEIKHRKIAVCFTPDEEVGGGTKHFSFEKFPANAAYTVDGGEIGEIEYENFNAASASVQIHGVNIHPGSAKDKMKNAILYACEFVSSLPAAETPVHTEGYEGFYHVSNVSGDESSAKIRIIIRDHDREQFELRKEYLTRLTAYFNEMYGKNTFTLSLHDTYYNMKEKILPHMELISNAEAAMKAAGVEPKIVPIRGGTDGASLSYKGLPCPNLCTGGANFHSIHEFIPVKSLEKMVDVLVNLVI